jgi:hypothetical protein
MSHNSSARKAAPHAHGVLWRRARALHGPPERARAPPQARPRPPAGQLVRARGRPAPALRPAPGAWARRAPAGARRGVWLRVGHATVPKGYAAGCTEFLCSAPSCDGRCLHRPCSCTLLRSHPAACDARPRALYRPWRTQHRSHDKRLSVRRPAPGHRRRGRDCRHALPSPHVVARRRRRRFLMSAAPSHPATIVASAGQRWRRRQRCRHAARARAARCPSRNRSRAIG